MMVYQLVSLSVVFASLGMLLFFSNLGKDLIRCADLDDLPAPVSVARSHQSSAWKIHINVLIELLHI